jgi:5-methylcytosine-specific restriction endonuclease McrA
MTAIKNNSLAKLSDSQIIKRLDDLVRKEHQTLLEVLRHLIEMDHRRLYLGRGYASLYEYCTRHLSYSESAASRRIKTARCIRDFPEVYRMLTKNEVNLSTVSKLSVVLNEKNKNELLEEVRFQSARQVDEIIARFRPMSILHERARPVYVKTSFDVPVIEKDQVENSSSSPGKGDQKFTADVGGKKLTTSCSIRTQMPVLEQKIKLEFAVSPAFMEKLEEVKALLSKKYPRGVSYEKIFEVMLDEYLEKHSPKRKDRRRNKWAAKQKDRKKNPTTSKEARHSKPTSTMAKIKISKENQPSRHIPAAVRDKVFARDKSRCTFVGKKGTRCNSAWNLQIDHITPYAKGGDHSLQNLRLLCGSHNKYEAERIYGRDFMERRIRLADSRRE